MEGSSSQGMERGGTWALISDVNVSQVPFLRAVSKVVQA